MRCRCHTPGTRYGGYGLFEGGDPGDLELIREGRHDVLQSNEAEIDQDLADPLVTFLLDLERFVELGPGERRIVLWRQGKYTKSHLAGV